MAKQQHEPVTFLDSAGNKISNDPVYRAQQTLEQAGVEDTKVDSSDLEDLRRENEELQARLAAAEALAASEQSEDGDESPEDAGSDEEEVDLDALDGAELKALAAERGVDISGLKKVGEVRQALRDAESE